MNPYLLAKDKRLHDRFIYLIKTHFKFVNSFSDESITPDVLRMYHRKKSVSNAMADFVKDVKQKLQYQGIPCKEFKSRDMRKTSDSTVGLQETNERTVVDLLDNKAREPRHLLFYPGALFAATVNTKTYAQSQTLLMIDMPTDKQLRNREPLKLFAAPPQDGILDEMLNLRQLPTKQELLDRKWTEVKVEVCSERFYTRDHTTACRRQYSMVHVAASTVSLFNSSEMPCMLRRYLITCPILSRLTSRWETHCIDHVQSR